MKTAIQIKIRARIMTLLVISHFFWSVTQAQSQGAAKKEAVIQLSFYKNADQGRYVVAGVSTRNDSGKLIYVGSAKIDFYLSQPAGESFIASAFTDEGGKASVQILGNLPADTSGTSFIARLTNDRTYADAEAEGTIKDARLVLSLSEKDTSRLITATVTEVTGNSEKPVANAEVSFGAKRLFGVVPLSDEATVTTDEQGMATFNMPKAMKGDEKGTIILVATITDNDEYGNVEASTAAQWGVPLMVDKNPFPRALWEPKAPVPLIIVFSIIFGGIWLTYSVVVYQISKIEKITPPVKS